MTSTDNKHRIFIKIGCTQHPIFISITRNNTFESKFVVGAPALAMARSADPPYTNTSITTLPVSVIGGRNTGQNHGKMFAIPVQHSVG